MKKGLYISAVEAAFKLRNLCSGVLVHSDAGSQYTSDAYKLMLGKHHAVQSMSDVCAFSVLSFHIALPG